jgi:SAM-dependent methyltransferase
VARQRDHYDNVAAKYVENLSYPHTIEYLNYLDKVFLEQIENSNLSDVAEICCGHGELLTLIDGKNVRGVGVDISSNMLEFARNKHRANEGFFFVQGDATKLPLKDSQFDSVFMFGGIHHVPDRVALFSEVFRILRPGGRFYFREPVSDFFLWRWIRAIIYSASPALDAETERPLLWKETVPLLEKIGFKLSSWKTYGFLGFCFFMNSDVLIFNRFFRFIPGIRIITRLAAYFDDVVVKLPGFSRTGLQVVGVAEKPCQDS